MEEIWHPPIEVGSLSHYLQGLIHPWWCRIPSINSIIHFLLWEPFFHSLFCHWKRTMACLSFPFFLVHSLIESGWIAERMVLHSKVNSNSRQFLNLAIEGHLGILYSFTLFNHGKTTKKNITTEVRPTLYLFHPPRFGKTTGKLPGDPKRKNRQTTNETAKRKSDAFSVRPVKIGFEAIQLWRRWQGITWSLKSPSVVETSVVWNNSLGDERGTTCWKIWKVWLVRTGTFFWENNAWISWGK